MTTEQLIDYLQNRGRKLRGRTQHHAKFTSTPHGLGTLLKRNPNKFCIRGRIFITGIGYKNLWGLTGTPMKYRGSRLHLATANIKTSL
jgi:hypothetical protein